MIRRRKKTIEETTVTAINGYVDGDSVVLVQREGGERTLRRVPADWCSYHLLEELGDLRRQIETSSHVSGTKVEGKWLRVSWRDRFARDRICRDQESPLRSRGIRTFEADLSPLRRYMLDHGLKVSAPRRAYLDIETDSRIPFARAREGDTRMFAWAIVAEDGEILRATKTYSRLAKRAESEDNGAPGMVGGLVEPNGCAMLARDATDSSERELLEAMWLALEPFDQVIAWGSQSGDTFDFAVIEHRSAELGVRVNTRQWIFLDFCALFARMNKNSAESGDEKVSLKLNAVATSLLGEGKDDFDASKTHEAFTADQSERLRLLRYNLKDTTLLPRIEADVGYIALHQTVSEACGVFPDTSAANPTTFVDQFILRLGLERGEHFPTKSHNVGNEQFKGAFVMEPKFKGITRNVHVCDFSSLYPSIIITWNMSPETKRGIQPPEKKIPVDWARAPGTNVCFDVREKGIFPIALEEMLRLRKFWNEKKAKAVPGSAEARDAERRSNAYKVAANSFYGFAGSPYSRVFDRELAESVTQAGAWLLLETKHAAENDPWNFFVGYGDTDSDFVQGHTVAEFQRFTDWCNAELYPKILKDRGCRDNRIKLAYEKQFDIIVMVSAKRYVGRFAHYKGSPATNKSKPEIKGLEYKRGDSARLARVLQEQIIKRLVGDWTCPTCKDHPEWKSCPKEHAPATEDVAAYEALIEDMRRHVLEDDLQRADVVVTQQLTKQISEYKPKPNKSGDGTDSLPAHVKVAKVLLERGAEVDAGTRIEFVVVDGEASPMKIIPADDFDGHFDRFHLWENKVWPPCEKLLVAAFPSHNWAVWAKARPPKRRRAPEGQMALGFGTLSASARPLTKERVVGESFDRIVKRVETSERSEESPRRRKLPRPDTQPSPGTAPQSDPATGVGVSVPSMKRRRLDTPYTIRIPERAASRDRLLRLRDLLLRPEHAGPRAVALTMVLSTGAEVELGAPLVRVRGTPELSAEIAKLLSGAS